MSKVGVEGEGLLVGAGSLEPSWETTGVQSQ
jgi:hypothetical protein